MDLADAYDLLATCQAFDRRTVGEVDAAAWHQTLHDLPLDDCRAAVTEHYTNSREWIMPADVRAGVKRLRAARISRAVELPPDADPDDVDAYLDALRDGRQREASGTRSVSEQIASTFRSIAPRRNPASPELVSLRKREALAAIEHARQRRTAAREEA